MDIIHGTVREMNVKELHFMCSKSNWNTGHGQFLGSDGREPKRKYGVDSPWRQDPKEGQMSLIWN